MGIVNFEKPLEKLSQYKAPTTTSGKEKSTTPITMYVNMFQVLYSPVLF